MSTEMKTNHSEYIERRVAALRQKPLAQLSPVPGADETLYGTFIGEVSAKTAFVRWASALQHKRDLLRREDKDYYVDTTFVASTWKDWAQCGGILRTASQREVRYSAQEAKFIEEWPKRARYMKLDKVVEFAWAAVEGKLTSLAANLVMETLRERADNEDVDPVEQETAAAFLGLLDAEQMQEAQAA